MIFVWTQPANSQTPDAFNPGASNTVYAIALQADGKVLVGGDFTALAGQPRSFLGRLNADGSLDLYFSPGASSTVRCLAVQSDGKILVGGLFISLGGQVKNGIGRLNADGTLDATFNPEPNNAVNCLTLQPDGKILLGGAFTSVAGQTRNRLARLHPDGTLDGAFNPNVSNTVSCLVVQPDGMILLGGNFTGIGGALRSRIARLNPNGSLDTFNPGSGGTVVALALQADGRILAGGGFTTLAGASRSRIARLEPDGTLDFNFDPGASATVQSLVAQADGRLVVAGNFRTLGGQACDRIGRLNNDGSLDPSFNPGASNSVYALAVQPDGKVLAGGQFTSLGGQPRNYLGRLNNTEPATESLSFDGANITWLRGGTAPETCWTSFEVSTNRTGWIALGAGTPIPGGWQVSGLGLPANATFWARGLVTGGQNSGSSWLVEAAIGQPALTRLPVSRTNNAATTAVFSTAAVGSSPLAFQWRKGGVNLNSGGNMSGTQSPTLTLNSVFGADAGGYSVVVSNAAGSATSSVVVLTVVDPLITSQPLSQAVEPGQPATFTVAVTGTTPGYQWRKSNLSLAGATGTSLVISNAQRADAGLYDVVVSNAFGSVTSSVVMLTVNLASLNAWNPGAGEVYSTVVQPDGKIFVGGSFGSLGGNLSPFYGRLNADGMPDPSFIPLSGLVDYFGSHDSVRCLAVQDDGKILLAGNFQFGRQGQSSFSGLLRLFPNGNFDPSVYSGLGSYDFIFAQTLQADGKIVVGGFFASLKGQTRDNLGRFNPDGSLDTSFNPGALCLPYKGIYTLALQPDGKILVGGGFTNLAGQARNFLGRLNTNGTLDAAFNPTTDNQVWCLAVQPDGKILVGGDFTTMGGQARTNFARLNGDGTLDAAFDPGFSFGNSPGMTIQSLALQTDGRILVGGSFSMLGRQARANLGRLYPDGSLDPTFNPGANDYIRSLMIQADGAILVGGYFTTLGGQTRNGLARLNNTETATQSLTFDGAKITWLRGGNSPEVWRTSFDLSTNGANWVSVGAGTRIAGGWQVIGLAFPSSASIRARGFVSSGLYNNSSWHLETYLGAPVVVGPPASRTNNPDTTATFSATAFGPPPISYRWRKDGNAIFDGGNLTGAGSPTLTVSNVFGADAGGYSIIVSNVTGSVTSQVAVLTVLDPLLTNQPVSQAASPGQAITFNIGAIGTAPLRYQWRRDGVALGGATTASLTLPNVQRAEAGRYDIIVTNTFGRATSSVASLSVNLASLDPASIGANWDVETFAIQADGKVLVGGSFDFLNDQPRNSIGRFNSDGTLDLGFNPGAGNVTCLAVQPDGKILVAGHFTTLGGSVRTNLGRLQANGTVDTTFDPGAVTTYDLINSFALQTNGQILVAGSISTLDNLTRTYLRRLNAAGSLDPAFNPVFGEVPYPFNTTVSSVAVQPDGKILVGGIFTALNGQARTNLGRLNFDGTPDASFNPGASGGGVGYSYSGVRCLALQANGKILVGGIFTALGGQSRTNLGRLNPDGTSDVSFAPVVDVSASNPYGPEVNSLSVQTDGKILVGGRFEVVNGQLRTNLARLEASGSLDLTFNPAAASTIGYDASVSARALALQADGRLWAGGRFGSLGGQGCTNVGRLLNPNAATQSLVNMRTNVTWLRGGASPEIWRAAFDYSTDSTNWVSLGAGVRIEGGWQLAGIALPTNATVRARGFLTGGNYNGSSWFVESLPQVTSESRPRILVNDGFFGINSNRFGFTLSAAAGRAVVVEASTNLVQWSPIHTNLMGNPGVYLFRDLASGVYARRFYRARFHNGSLPLPSVRPGTAAIQNGKFGFNLDGIAGQVVIIETSTNLANWVTLTTNTLGNTPFIFSDPGSTNFPLRFYRARLQ